MPPKTDFEAIYRDQAEDYDRLVAAEDCDGNLAPAIAALVPLAGAVALEVGAGTGRLTQLLVERGCRVVAFERSRAMIAVARQRLAECDSRLWHIEQADARQLPLDDGLVDFAIAGWVFGHLRYWEAPGWRHEIGRALSEMSRTVRPGGALLIIETLGTGSEQPAAPNDELSEYYAWLEAEQGFRRTVVRTDFAFPDAETAARTTAFFFGEEFANRVRRRGWTHIPEHTGLWHKTTP